MAHGGMSDRNEVMPLADPSPIRSPAQRSSHPEPQHEHAALQAGRSPANLAAHAAAQALRTTARPRLPPQPRPRTRPRTQYSSSDTPFSDPIPAPIISNSTVPTSDLIATDDVPARNTLAPGQPRHPARRTSNTLSSVSSDSSQPGPDGESATSSSSSLSKTEAATVAAAALAPEMVQRPGRRFANGPISTTNRPEMPATYRWSTSSLPRQTPPRSVRDLGSDYTRYFNPFESRNNSYTSLASIPPASIPPPPARGSPLEQSIAAPIAPAARSVKFLPPTEEVVPDNPFATAPGTPVPETPLIEPDEDVLDEKSSTKPVTSVAMPPQKSSTVHVSSMGRGNAALFPSDMDPEKMTFYPYLDDRLGAPRYGVPLFTDEQEDDDDMHMPRWDDDIRLKPKFKDHFTRENIVSTLGMFFMIIGLLCVFVVLPVISFTGTSIIDYTFETPIDQMPNPDAPQTWATVNDRKYPFLQNLRTGLIDPDTPEDVKSMKGVNGDDYVLVFSDEFNKRNRTFYPGDDPYWFGGDFWYGATQDLEWYDPDALNTGDGVLSIQLDKFANHGLEYRSGMLNSWNQLCFKGGIFEVSMSLPGPAGRHLWWPGVWTMGNLGRPGYLATTDGLWPYTYQECDTGITPNQSMPDGTSHLPGQRLPSCTCANEDHPTPGTGRGAPEIDIAEVSADWGGLNVGVATQSFQVAPFDIWYYPNYDFMQTPNYSLSFVNTYTGGPFQEAVSTTSMLNNNWYDGIQYQKYSFEYAPGSGKDAYIAWKIGDDETMRFDARAIGPNGNIGQRLIAEEPLSMILNLGFSKNWVLIDYEHFKIPTVMRVDYVRWYQKEGQEMVTCDPPGYETTQYIADHPEAYQNPNFTRWTDAGYKWPENTLMNGCNA